MRGKIVMAFLLACDPVNDAAVAALGGEAPNVPRGPNHRPGQPCLVCHDGSVGNPPGFSVAGTVYANTAADAGPAVDAGVMLTDSQNNQFLATTNVAGNFFVLPHQFRPVYPMKVAVTFDTGDAAVTVNMTADVGRDGSCAKCHFDPAGPASPGHVYTTDAGTP
jgi:hypothetical protein